MSAAAQEPELQPLIVGSEAKSLPGQVKFPSGHPENCLMTPRYLHTLRLF